MTRTVLKTGMTVIALTLASATGVMPLLTPAALAQSSGGNGGGGGSGGGGGGGQGAGDDPASVYAVRPAGPAFTRGMSRNENRTHQTTQRPVLEITEHQCGGRLVQAHDRHGLPIVICDIRR